MIGENLKSLFLLYPKPIAAISRILDSGTLWFAIVAALIVSVLVHMPQRGLSAAERSAVRAAAEARETGADDDVVNAAASRAYLHPGAAEIALSGAGQWIGVEGGSMATLGALALAFLPLLVAVRAVSGFGSFAVLMRSEYVSLLMCTLSAWAVAYIPVAVLEWTVPLPATGLVAPVLFMAANIYFLVLTALSLRTLTGSGLTASLGLAGLAAVAAIAGLTVYNFAGGFGGASRFYLLSPFFLYFAYRYFSSDVRSLGEGLRSRQHLRRQLEIATTNPHDADAHYQLGLIYQKRRQYSEAIARFERSVAIDATDADSHLQLGRIALEQNRCEAAVGYLETAAKLNEKVSSSEVWRDLGAAYLGVARIPEAVQALEKYANRWPYDPEGLYYLGKALAAMGKQAEAKERFKECIEAVKTSPGHRRAYVRKWGNEAQAVLRTMK